jgi:hypothetical protein
MIEEMPTTQLNADLAKIKELIAAVKNLTLAEHSYEFEKIHQQLQQALTNLDGV